MARSKRNKREREQHHRWLLENGWYRTWASGLYRQVGDPVPLLLISRRRGGAWVATGNGVRVSPNMASPQAAQAYAELMNWGRP